MPGYHHNRKIQKSTLSSDSSSVYNRCYNPMKIADHNRTRALRGTSKSKGYLSTPDFEPQDLF